jgi:four helix bundle protein
MTQQQMKDRTKKFAIQTIMALRKLPKNTENEVISKQLIKSSTSVAANYRATCRAKSKADFINKVKVVEEEADESCFWMEVITEIDTNQLNNFNLLLKEAGELTAIFTATGKTIRSN